MFWLLRPCCQVSSSRVNLKHDYVADKTCDRNCTEDVDTTFWHSATEYGLVPDQRWQIRDETQDIVHVQHTDLQLLGSAAHNQECWICWDLLHFLLHFCFLIECNWCGKFHNKKLWKYSWLIINYECVLQSNVNLLAPVGRRKRFAVPEIQADEDIVKILNQLFQTKAIFSDLVNTCLVIIAKWIFWAICYLILPPLPLPSNYFMYV